MNKTKKRITNKYGSTLNVIQNNEIHIGLDLHEIKIYQNYQNKIQKHRTHNYPTPNNQNIQRFRDYC